MMQKSLLTIVISVLFFHLATAQKITVVFDSSGRMIEFPPAVIRRHTNVTFRVKISAIWLESEKSVLTKLLKQTDAALGDDKIKAAYKCLLGEVPFANYTGSLTLAEDALKGPAFTDPDNLITLQQFRSDVIPVEDFVGNIVKKQFEVKIYNGSTLLQTLSLTLDAFNKDQKYIYFSTKEVFAANKNKVLSGSAATDQFRFVLLQHDPLNQTVINWYAARMTELTALPGMNDNQIKNGLDNIGVGDEPNFQNALTKVKQLNTWFTKWFWFTKGDLALNPFADLEDAAMKELAQKIVNLKIHMTHLQEQLNFYDSCIFHLWKVERNIPRLQRLQTDRDLVVKSWKKDSADLKANEKSFSSANGVADIAIAPAIYSGDLFTSITGRMNVMKQFDASMDYRSAFKFAHPVWPNRWSKERVTEIPENESIYLIIQNTPSGAKLGFGEKRFDYDDQEEFTKLVSEQLAKVDFSSIPAGNLSNLSAFAEGLARPNFAKSGFGGGGADNCAAGSNLQKLLVAVRDRNYKFPPDPDVFQAKDGTTPAYSSTTKMASLTQQYEAPFRDSITIQDVSKPDAPKDLAKSYVKVGALRTVQITAGVAFVRTPTATTSIDTSGNGFKATTNDNAATIVVGFKVYPFRNYNRDKGLIPRYFFRRISAFGGFDMLHPLNNFYLGGAYDIVPGLAVAIGNNYYKQTRYTVADNQIVDTKHAYADGGLFYSVTVNPTLFVQFVKLFFK